MRSSAASKFVLFLASSLLACSTGDGTGWVRGEFHDPGCSTTGVFDLEPDFFGADPTRDGLEIRIQHGGDYELFSDAVFISVRDAAAVRARIGQSIPVAYGPTELVQMTFFYNDICGAERRDGPRTLVATSGNIVFDEVYAPNVASELAIAVHFENVVFQEVSEMPTDRQASLSGAVRFVFNRGRPAQRYP